MTNDGRPVQFERIQLQEKNVGLWPIWLALTFTTTNAKGEFAFRGLRTIPNGNPLRVHVGGRQGSGNSWEFQIGDGQPKGKIEVICEAPASVSGVVLDIDGKPVSGARVWLRDCDAETGRVTGGSIAEIISDRNGRYRHVGVAPGGHFLHAFLKNRGRMPRGERPTIFEVKPSEEVKRELRLK